MEFKEQGRYGGKRGRKKEGKNFVTEALEYYVTRLEPGEMLTCSKSEVSVRQGQRLD